MKTKHDYEALQAALAAIESKTGAYLADVSIDKENVNQDETRASYWSEMCDAALSAAAFRAEDAGFDLREHGIDY